MRAELTALGADEIVKKYGSYSAASVKLGVAFSTLVSWLGPTPTPYGTGRDSDFPDLPTRSADCLRTIIRLSSVGRPPSVREITRAMGLTGTNGIAQHVARLADRGYLVKHPGRGSRRIQLTEKAGAGGAAPLADIKALADIVLYYEDRTSRHAAAAIRVKQWLDSRTKQGDPT